MMDIVLNIFKYDNLRICLYLIFININVVTLFIIILNIYILNFFLIKNHFKNIYKFEYIQKFVFYIISTFKFYYKLI